MKLLFYGKIYMIKNNINNKVYIGQTILNDVLHDRYGGNVEKHTHNDHLRNAIHKYGWNSRCNLLSYDTGGYNGLPRSPHSATSPVSFPPAWNGTAYRAQYAAPAEDP